MRCCSLARARTLVNRRTINRFCHPMLQAAYGCVDELRVDDNAVPALAARYPFAGTGGDPARRRENCVPVGPFDVLDARTADVVARMVNAMPPCVGGGCHVAFDLHVGAFLHTEVPGYVDVINGADTVYADGASVVLLAKAAGARSIERSPTTDIGWDVLRAAQERFGRPARIALIGGPEGLAERAAHVLENAGLATCLGVADGFQRSYAPFLDTLREESVEIIFVGMGMPLEAMWVERYRPHLGAALVMTCGGWFGFVVDDERRSPRWVRRIGMEWTWRIAQAPRRLARRYALGARRTAQFLPGQLRFRRTSRR
jgi:N-acetylglucosaminyldiphosphoundecaprenol N-acetyl-beta-D-mannosaminyltransferase